MNAQLKEDETHHGKASRLGFAVAITAVLAILALMAIWLGGPVPEKAGTRALVAHDSPPRDSVPLSLAGSPANDDLPAMEDRQDAAIGKELDGEAWVGRLRRPSAPPGFPSSAPIRGLSGSWKG